MKIESKFESKSIWGRIKSEIKRFLDIINAMDEDPYDDIANEMLNEELVYYKVQKYKTENELKKFRDISSEEYGNYTEEERVGVNLLRSMMMTLHFYNLSQEFRLSNWLFRAKEKYYIKEELRTLDRYSPLFDTIPLENDLDSKEIL